MIPRFTRRDYRCWNACSRALKFNFQESKKEKKDMYEKPNLNRVGAAQDVILGIMEWGSDVDGTWMEGQDEFAFDGDSERS